MITLDVTEERSTMSFVSFDAALDIIRNAHDEAAQDDSLTYLNTMVSQADKEMVVALAKRFRVSQGFVMRAIFDQWRAAVLAADDVRE